MSISFGNNPDLISQYSNPYLKQNISNNVGVLSAGSVFGRERLVYVGYNRIPLSSICYNTNRLNWNNHRTSNSDSQSGNPSKDTKVFWTTIDGKPNSGI